MKIERVKAGDHITTAAGEIVLGSWNGSFFKYDEYEIGEDDDLVKVGGGYITLQEIANEMKKADDQNHKVVVDDEEG